MRARLVARVACVGAIACATLLPRAVVAQERPLREALAVTSTDPCVTLDGIVEHLSSLRDAIGIDARITVRLDAAEDRAGFEIARDGASVGRREFARLPRACGDRRALLALTIALALDDTLLRPFEVQPTHEAPVVPPTDAVPAPPAIDPHASQVMLRAEGGAVVGLLADVAALAALEIAVGLGEGFSLRLGGLFVGGGSLPLGRGAAQAMLAGGRGAVCLGRELISGLALDGCVGAALAAFSASGRGFAEDFQTAAPWAAATGRVELRGTVADWLALYVAVEGQLAFVSPTLVVTDTSAALASATPSIGAVIVAGGVALILR